MRKLLILPLIILFGCSSGTPQNSVETTPSDVTSSVNQSKAPELTVIGHYDIPGGFLHVYFFEGDTIYWAEGQSSGYPVSIVIK